eukprot:913133-Karenia_brevis.AAC.1
MHAVHCNGLMCRIGWGDEDSGRHGWALGRDVQASATHVVGDNGLIPPSDLVDEDSDWKGWVR